MIKFKGTKDGKPVYGFGLSRGNLVRLLEGMPIVVDLAEMGGEGTVVIHGGETEEEMARELLGPDVEIRKQEQDHEGPFG